MNCTRRKLAIVLALASLFGSFGAARAAWPERAITVIVPAAAGSSLDQNVRRVMEDVGKGLKQPIVIDNRPGGGGLIGLAAVAQAAPDGYTFGLGNTAGLVITPEINPKAKDRYNTATDFEYVVRMTNQPNLLVVKNTLPFKNVTELTQHLKANPGKLFMGSQGNGSTGHLSGELYKKAAGVDFSHVPYRSGPQAVQDILAGNVDFLFENVSTIESLVESGKVKAIAVTSAKRNPRFPNIPTMQESGVSGYEMSSWVGLVGPAKLPKEVVVRMNEAVNAALNNREVKTFIMSRGGMVDGGTSAEFKAFAAEERARWQARIKSMGKIALE